MRIIDDALAKKDVSQQFIDIVNDSDKLLVSATLLDSDDAPLRISSEAERN